MKLVLAEKPSVAMSLSKVIGADQRGDGYMEGNGYLVSWLSLIHILRQMHFQPRHIRVCAMPTRIIILVWRQRILPKAQRKVQPLSLIHISHRA